MNDCMKRASGQRPRKRHFKGNRFTKCEERNASEAASSSYKKLNSSQFENEFIATDSLDYRIIDINILFSKITDCLCCKVCGSDVDISESLKNGLSSIFSIKCQNCSELSAFRNSRMMGKKSNVPEINRRFIYSMRCIGQGFCAMKTFCGAMDLPEPIHKTAYNKAVKQILPAVKKVASTSMLHAAKQEVELTGQSELTVSGDGSWKTRGHSSKVGIVSVVGVETGKVLDIEVMSSFCKGCEIGKKKKGAEFETWKTSHEIWCVKNHFGSAGMMEVNGILKVFSRSEALYEAKYVNYIGDGDTKTFLELQKSHVYGPNTDLNKVECVGHIQKRMGSRLRQLKNSMRGKKLADGKPLSGKGRLTDKFIDQITIYYGNAIRNNKDSVSKMRKAIWAIYYHKRSNDSEPLHDFCPNGLTSWCVYQKAKANNNLKDFKHNITMPTPVMDCIKNIFKDLSDPKLLKRCLGGRTQNSNESYNSNVWKLCPKTSGSNKVIAEIAANEAVVSFNEGRKGRLEILKSLGFSVGQNAIKAAKKADAERIKAAEIAAKECTLEARRSRHLLNASNLEKIAEKEGVVYESGKF